MRFVPCLESLENRITPTTIDPILQAHFTKLLTDAASGVKQSQIVTERTAVDNAIVTTFSSPKFAAFDVLPGKSNFVLGNTLQQDLQRVADDFAAAKAMVGHKGAWQPINTFRTERAELIHLLQLQTTPPKQMLLQPKVKPAVAPAPPPTATETITNISFVAVATETAASYVPDLGFDELSTYAPSDGTDLTYIFLASYVVVDPAAGIVPTITLPSGLASGGIGTNGADELGPEAVPPPVVAGNDGNGNSWSADSITMRDGNGNIVSQWTNPNQGV